MFVIVRLFSQLLLLLALCAGGCATLDDERARSPWYDGSRFRNLDNDDEITEKSFWTMLRWKWFSRREPDKIPGVSDTPPETKKIQPAALLADPGKIRITWIGHATAFISVNHRGKLTNILTDPIFGKIFTVSRLTEMPVPPEELPPVALVVVSHSHYDHCDLDTLRFLQQRNPQLRIVLPEGQKQWGILNGLTGAESMRWFTARSVDTVRVHFLPAHHWSFRVPGDRMQFHWGSYAFTVENTSVYFGGDTGYSSHFKKIGQNFPKGFAAALLPIGAYSPRWFMKAAHIDPPEAVMAAQDLNAQMLLPVHWATFRQSDEKMLEPILYLQAEAEKKKLPYRHWSPGESYEVDIR